MGGLLTSVTREQVFGIPDPVWPGAIFTADQLRTTSVYGAQSNQLCMTAASLS